MKKISKLFIAILAVVFLAAAQNNVKAQAFQNGNVVGNLGFGFGWYGFNGYSPSSFPAISVSVEKGITDFDFGVLSVGGIMGYKHASWNSPYSYDWSWNDFAIGPRAAIHADILQIEKLDTYAALGFVLLFRSRKYNDPYGRYDDSSVDVYPSVNVGARYYLTEQLAVFGELGFNVGYFNIGLSYKFN